jgi:hypothetical protein
LKRVSLHLLYIFARLKITCVMKIGHSLKMSIVVVKNGFNDSGCCRYAGFSEHDMINWLVSKVEEANIILLSNLSILRVPEEGYSRNASCALNLMSTFLMLSPGRYICCWTISLDGIIRPVVSVSVLTLSIIIEIYSY